MKKHPFTRLLLIAGLPALAGLVALVLLSTAQAAEPFIGSFSINKGSFAEIYNTLRFAQPKNVPWAGTYWPYADNGIAALPNGQDSSPAARFDKQFGLGTKTTDFEVNNHTCSKLSADQLVDCQGWYGHCNAWSAAATREPEPRQAVQVGGNTFSVADQKAYLTEMWMQSGTLFGGTTVKSLKTGDWVTDPHSADGAKMNGDTGSSNYDSFWDVSPKNLVLLFANYIGAMKLGVVIDRFTGDEVWNQPIAGYRILPLRDEDLGSEVKNGVTVYFARVRMKIYWANDGVEPGVVSSVFDIAKTTDDEAAEYFPGNDYTARLLKFRLFFDAPVVLGPNTTLTSAGRMIGKGLWSMQETPPSSMVWYDHSHPDFVWMPTQLYFSSGYGNPTLTAARVYQITHASPVPVSVPVPAPAPSVEPILPVPSPEVPLPQPSAAIPSSLPSVNPLPLPSAEPSIAPTPIASAEATVAPPSPPSPSAAPHLMPPQPALAQPASLAGTEGEITPNGTRHIVKVKLTSFTQRDVVFMKGKIFRTLRRADIQSLMKAEDLKIVGDHVEQPGIFPANQTLAQIYAALEEAGYQTVP